MEGEADAAGSAIARTFGMLPVISGATVCESARANRILVRIRQDAVRFCGKQTPRNQDTQDRVGPYGSEPIP
jgi:hypothetical protein